METFSISPKNQIIVLQAANGDPVNYVDSHNYRPPVFLKLPAPPPPPIQPVYYEASMMRFILRPQHLYAPNDEDFFRKDLIGGVYLKNLLKDAQNPVSVDDGEKVVFSRYKWKRIRIAVDWPGLDWPPMVNFNLQNHEGKRKSRQELACAIAQVVKTFHVKVTSKRRWKLSDKPKRTHPLELKDYMGNPRPPMRVLPPDDVDFDDIRLISLQFRKNYWIPILGVDKLPKYQSTPGLLP